MISSQLRYTYSNMEMILNGCGSHMVFIYKMFALLDKEKLCFTHI